LLGPAAEKWMMHHVSEWTQNNLLVQRSRKIPSPPILEPSTTLFLERFGPCGEAFDESVANEDNLDDVSEGHEPGASIFPTIRSSPVASYCLRLFNLPYERTNEILKGDVIGMLEQVGFNADHLLSAEITIGDDGRPSGRANIRFLSSQVWLMLRALFVRYYCCFLSRENIFRLVTLPRQGFTARRWEAGPSAQNKSERKREPSKGATGTTAWASLLGFIEADDLLTEYPHNVV
jgi:hypothetical protein